MIAGSSMLAIPSHPRACCRCWWRPCSRSSPCSNAPAVGSRRLFHTALNTANDLLEAAGLVELQSVHS